MEEERIKKEAVRYVRTYRKEILEKYIGTRYFKGEESPVSVFMAGSPGAGKTEFSRELVKLLEGDAQGILRIDPDDFRKYLPGYSGDNSYLFNQAVSILVDEVHSYALKHSQSFVLDGTLSNFDKAESNIEKSLQLQRAVFVFYVYQEPSVAWRFTEKREKVEGRNIPLDDFARKFEGARVTLERLIDIYDERVRLFLVKKNFNDNTVEFIKQIDKNNSLDRYIKKRYTASDILLEIYD